MLALTFYYYYWTYGYTDKDIYIKQEAGKALVYLFSIYPS